jgi:excisionase family DNA binding protein
MTHQTELSRDHAAVPPLAVTVARACELTGFGQTSIWAFIRDGRLAAVRLAGVRRTLISYESLRQLLESAGTQPRAKRRRGRPRKAQPGAQHEAMASQEAVTP